MFHHQTDIRSRVMTTAWETRKSQAINRALPVRSIPMSPHMINAWSYWKRYDGYIDMIPYQAAHDAHRGTSFTPDTRAHQEKESFAQSMMSAYSDIQKAANDHSYKGSAHETEKIVR